MWVIRGRGRNLRLLTVCGFLLIFTFLYLEYDTIATISSDQPFFITIDNGYHANGIFSQKCKSTKNLAYIKMMKSASTTLASMFRRFAYSNNLSCVLPIEDKIYLGWPHPIQDSYYRKRKSDTFNLLCDHVVYDGDKFKSFMPNDTILITSIREPFSQFKSTFHYYNIHGVSQMLRNQTYEHYLRDILLYEQRYTSHDNRKLRHCVPDGFSVTRNIMAFNLGFPTGFNRPDMSQDQEFIEQWLKKVDNEFSLVLIVEYFHESLVLLRRKLCWNFEDILFFNMNAGEYKHKVRDTELVEIHKKWSNVDYSLYKHFNDTLRQTLTNQDAEFWREVAHLKLVAMEIERFCDSFPPEGAGRTIPERKLPRIALEVKATPWHPRFVIDEKKCQILKKEFMSELKERYDKQPPFDVVNSAPKTHFC